MGVPVADTARQTVTSVPLSPEVIDPLLFSSFSSDNFIWYMHCGKTRLVSIKPTRRGSGMSQALMISTFSKEESTLCLLKLVYLLRDVNCGFSD
jgi:hypothetical protein